MKIFQLFQLPYSSRYAQSILQLHFSFQVLFGRLCMVSVVSAVKRNILRPISSVALMSSRGRHSSPFTAILQPPFLLSRCFHYSWPMNTIKHLTVINNACPYSFGIRSGSVYGWLGTWGLLSNWRSGGA